MLWNLFCEQHLLIVDEGDACTLACGSKTAAKPIKMWNPRNVWHYAPGV